MRIDSFNEIAYTIAVFKVDTPMTIARSRQIDTCVIRSYHCVTRCVRRAFLLGEGICYRKEWIERPVEEVRTYDSAFRANLSRIRCRFSVGRFDDTVVDEQRALRKPIRVVGSFPQHL
jgi:hypothetical protein